MKFKNYGPGILFPAFIKEKGQNTVFSFHFFYRRRHERMCLMVESACDVTPDWLRSDFVRPQSFWRRRSQVGLV